MRANLIHCVCHRMLLFIKCDIAGKFNVNKRMHCQSIDSNILENETDISVCFLHLAYQEHFLRIFLSIDLKKVTMHSAEELKQRTVRAILNLPQNPNGWTLRQLNGK